MIPAPMSNKLAEARSDLEQLLLMLLLLKLLLLLLLLVLLSFAYHTVLQLL